MAGKATGERIPGKQYRMIVQAAANGDSISRAAAAANVTWHSANAIVQRESRHINERKRELADQAARIAAQTYNRLEDEAHTLPLQSAMVLAGIMTDKLAVLTNQPEPNQHLHLHVQPVDLIGNFNQLLERLAPNVNDVQRVQTSHGALSAATATQSITDTTQNTQTLTDTDVIT